LYYLPIKVSFVSNEASFDKQILDFVKDFN